jgi:predicted dehydrogenase
LPAQAERSTVGGVVVRVAVLGCGFQGRVHLNAFRALPDVEVVAVCDVDAERSARLAAEFGVRAHYTDYAQLLDEHELELVTVCTMPNTHRELTLAALRRGAHVLCEKPFALDLEEARTMTNAARAADRLLSVGFNMRFTDNALALHELVAAGHVGAPVYARAWGRAGEPPWWGRHYEKAVSGGGALAATAVHLLDLCLWTAGFPLPLSVSASATTAFPLKRRWTAPTPEAAAAYDVEDLVSAHVRFEGGFWLTLEGAWVWDRPGWDYSFELQAENALLEFDPLRVTRESEGELLDATPRIERPIDWAVDFPLSVGREIADVVGAVRESRPPVVRPEEALIVQAITDAVYRSAETGVEVQVERVDEPLTLEVD